MGLKKIQTMANAGSIIMTFTEVKLEIICYSLSITLTFVSN